MPYTIGSMTFSHLARAAERLAAKLPDWCEIRRPPTRTYNPSTMLMEDTDGSLIYQGCCLLTERQTEQTTELDAGQSIIREASRLRLPVNDPDTDDVQIGDVVTVTSSVRDSLLEGESFEVIDVRKSSTSVTRILGLRSMERAPGVIG